MKPTMRIIIGLVIILILPIASQSIQTPKELKSENSKGFAVLELFTSEGCNTCPPADALIEQLQREDKNGELYILAFHVDYWDHQGWKDRFSDPAFTLRQRMYAIKFNLHAIYTPQLIVNGTTEHVGSNRNAIQNAISAELKKESTQSLALDYKIGEGKIRIDYKVGNNKEQSELVFALVQKNAQSDVKAGENTGRSLSHVQIVRSMHRVKLDGKTNTEMKLPKDFNKNEWELIGFIQNKGNGRITGAAKLDFSTTIAKS